jgi:hypothetical protein
MDRKCRRDVVQGVRRRAEDRPDKLAIDSKTGRAAPNGDITALQTLASFGRTMLASVGVGPAVIATQITSGQVITGALV